MSLSKVSWWGFPDGSVVKNLPANAGEMDLIPDAGTSSGEGNGNSLQYSCLENSMDGGAWLGGLQSMGSQRVEHNWEHTHTHTHTHTDTHTHTHIFYL